MTRNGWTVGDLKAGDKVTVVGNPDRKEARLHVLAEDHVRERQGMAPRKGVLMPRAWLVDRTAGRIERLRESWLTELEVKRPSGAGVPADIAGVWLPDASRAEAVAGPAATDTRRPRHDGQLQPCRTRSDYLLHAARHAAEHAADAVPDRDRWRPRSRS